MGGGGGGAIYTRASPLPIPSLRPFHPMHVIPLSRLSHVSLHVSSSSFSQCVLLVLLVGWLHPSAYPIELPAAAHQWGLQTVIMCRGRRCARWRRRRRVPPRVPHRIACFSVSSSY